LATPKYGEESKMPAPTDWFLEAFEPRLLLAGDLIHTTANLSVAREGAQVASVGNDIFFAGGQRNPKRYTKASDK
jgi:hypothetical protein